jgi:hypothetical protein
MSGNQSHLTIEFPIKSAADAKALGVELPPLMPAFAKAQDAVGSVHYSRFLAMNEKTLLFLADIDGDEAELSAALAKSAGQVFDTIFKHAEAPPPSPVANNPAAFIRWMKHHSLSPSIVYSACGDSSVQEIQACARAAQFTSGCEQHPLLVSLPLKSSFKAFVLEDLVLRAAKGKMDAGANSVGTLHFCHFVPLADNHVGFFTVFDGAFDTYIKDFTEQMGPVFDALFEYVSDPPATPVAKNAEAFLKYATVSDLRPIGFYSAYPGLAVQDIKTLLADAKAGKAKVNA